MKLFKTICIAGALLASLVGSANAGLIDNVVNTYTGNPLNISWDSVNDAGGVVAQWFNVPEGKVCTKFEFFAEKGTVITDPNMYVNVFIAWEWGPIMGGYSASLAEFGNSSSMWVPADNLFLPPGNYYAIMFTNNAPLQSALFARLVNGSEYEGGFAAHGWKGEAFLADNQDYQARITLRDRNEIGWYDDRWGKRDEIGKEGAELALPYLSGIGFNEYANYLGECFSNNLGMIVEYNRYDIGIQNYGFIYNLTNGVNDNPATFGWYTADEPFGNALDPASLSWAYGVIKTASSKPVVMSFNSADVTNNNISALANAYDTFILNNYISRTTTAEFEGMNDWAQLMAQTGVQAKTVNKTWYPALQAFGEGDQLVYGDEFVGTRLPTKNETRFQAYWSIINGARGIMFFSHEITKATYANPSMPYPYSGTQWIQDVSTPIIAEIKPYMKAIQAGPVAGVTINSNRSDIKATLFQQPHTGEYYLMAAKSSAGQAAANFTIGGLPVSVSYAKPINENRGAVTISNGSFSDSFNGYQVHIYKLTGWSANGFQLYNGNDLKVDNSTTAGECVEYFMVPEDTVATSVSARVGNNAATWGTACMRIYDANNKLVGSADIPANWNTADNWNWIAVSGLNLAAGTYRIHVYGSGSFGSKLDVARFANSTAPMGAAAGYDTIAIGKLDGDYWVKLALTPAQIATPAALDEAKTLADGTLITSSNLVATTNASDFNGFIYVQTDDRTCGMRAATSSVNGTLARGSVVSVTGELATLSTGERYIKNAVVTVTGTGTAAKPLGMNNRNLGGGNVGNPAAGLGQYGVADASGANNVGLLVRVWGNVTYSGTDYVEISDGSGASVRVDTTGLATQPTGFVTLTGISGLYGTTGNASRMVLAID